MEQADIAQQFHVQIGHGKAGAVKKIDRVYSRHQNKINIVYGT